VIQIMLKPFILTMYITTRDTYNNTVGENAFVFKIIQENIRRALVLEEVEL